MQVAPWGSIASPVRQAARAAVSREAEDVFVPLRHVENGGSFSWLQKQKPIVPFRLKFQVDGDGVMGIHVAVRDEIFVPDRGQGHPLFTDTKHAEFVKCHLIFHKFNLLSPKHLIAGRFGQLQFNSPEAIHANAVKRLVVDGVLCGALQGWNGLVSISQLIEFKAFLIGVVMDGLIEGVGPK